MTDAKLLPCPFCGSGVLNIAPPAVYATWVWCSYCGAEGPPHRLEHKAITAWNRRGRADELVEVIAEELHATRAGVMPILNAHPHPAIVALKIIASMGSDKNGWDAARIASVALKAMGEA